jgi:methylglutaconyl-CoA hydratase
MEHLSLDTGGPIGSLTLDRPPANALDVAFAAELSEAVEHLAAAGDAVRALIIKSANPRFFMAGGDIKGYAARSTDEVVELVASFRELFASVEDLPMPTIAAVDGIAFGGGAELMLACDLRVVSPRAEIAVPEILIGGLPSAGGTQLLPRIVGYPVALELMLSGRAVDAREAERIGLVSAVAEDPVARAAELAGTFAELSPVATRWIKTCARSAFEPDREHGRRVEDDATRAVCATDTFKAKVRQFAERGVKAEAETR